MDNQLSPISASAASASATAKALRRLLVRLGAWAAIAATALDHGVPA
jgi:hypothetical protein